MKNRYRRVDVTSLRGILTAERLKANGWEIIRSSPFSIQFHRRASEHPSGSARKRRARP